MKVLYWNISKKNQPISGVKRYEEELFLKMRDIDPKSRIQRIQRLDNELLGNVPLSWLYRYPVGDADIVHATYQTLAPRAYLHRPKKFVLSVLDLTPMVYPVTQIDISTKFQWFITPNALKIPDKIIAISEFTKKQLIRLCGIDASKIEVIYLGVDHSRYHPMDRIICRLKFGLHPDKKYILVVASNLPHKRMDITKKVFDRVKKDFPETSLLKVGYGDTLNGEGIINLGWVKEEDMPFLYNSADVFLHTSEYEGFGLPVLEAMACGVPVVVSSSASLPEIVGKSGDLIDLSHHSYIEKFSTTIIRILQEGQGISGQERGKVFTWERTVKETYNLYETLVGCL